LSLGGFVRAWAHLAVLWAFAVAQPVLQVLADSAAFLVARGNAWPDLVLVTLGLVLVPPTAMVAIEAVLPRPSLRRYLHLAFVGLLVAAFAFQVLKGSLVPVLESCLALGLGLGLAFAYDRGRLVPTVLSVLSPVPLLLLVWFLGFSPASELAWPGTGPEVERGTVPRPAPVVVVIFDELSSAALLDGRRRIDATRWPNFAALAKESTWYRNATTVADQTTRAVPAIMTGRLRGEGVLPIRADHPGSLFDRLGGQFDFNVKETITHLCADELCGQTREEWPTRARRLAGSMASIERRRLSPGDTSDYLGVPAETVERRPEIFREFVERIGPGRTLSLHHSDLPHVPYQYTRYRRYTTATDLPGLSAEHWTEDPEPVREGLRRYLKQLGLVDRLVGDLVEHLKRIGLFDRALVVVTADHGVAFQAGESRRNVGVRNIGEIAGVPLLIKAPGQRRGRIVDSSATTEDILPTIGSLLGARWSAGGRSLESASGTAPVTVSGEGGPVTVPFAEFIRRRDQAADRVAALNP
jgi:hypothetical protein